MASCNALHHTFQINWFCAPGLYIHPFISWIFAMRLNEPSQGNPLWSSYSRRGRRRVGMWDGAWPYYKVLTGNWGQMAGAPPMAPACHLSPSPVSITGSLTTTVSHVCTLCRDPFISHETFIDSRWIDHVWFRRLLKHLTIKCIYFKTGRPNPSTHTCN